MISSFIGLILLNGLVVTVQASSANDLLWTKTYGGLQDDAANCISNTSDGGFIITGYTNSYGNGTSNIWLIKTDSNGVEQWNRTFGGPKEDVGYSVIQTKDGGYAVTGYTTSYGNGSMNVFLLKTDKNGMLLWNRTYGGNMTDGAFSLAQTTDGGFILTGFTYSFGHGGWDMYLIKTDDEGNLQWYRAFGGPAKDCGHAVIQTADGGYAVTGYTKSFGNRGGDQFGVGAEDLWLVKTDAQGNEQWNRTYGGSDYDDGFSILQNADGGFTIAGVTKSFTKNNTPQAYSSNNTARAYLIRTDSAGNLVWNKTYGGATDTAGFSLARATDGGYVIAGTIFTNDSAADVFALRTDSNGTQLWANAYGGSNDDYGFSISPTSDKNFVIAGFTKSYGNGNSDVFVLKIADTTGTSSNGSGMFCGALAIFPLVAISVILIGRVKMNKK